MYHTQLTPRANTTGAQQSHTTLRGFLFGVLVGESRTKRASQAKSSPALTLLTHTVVGHEVAHPAVSHYVVPARFIHAKHVSCFTTEGVSVAPLPLVTGKPNFKRAARRYFHSDNAEL